jgi:hypothetical protein
MNESEDLQPIAEETAPISDKTWQVVVIGAGPIGLAQGRSLASRLIANYGNRIEIVEPKECGLSTDSLSMLPTPAPKDIYTAQMAGAHHGKGQRKARWNRKNRWR